MNKTLIAVVVGVVIVGGGAWYYMGQHTSGTYLYGNDSATTTSEENAQSSSGTLASLAARSGSWKCDVSSSDANSQSSGTVYVSNGKIRGDFTSQTQAGEVTSHMVSDGSYVYVWSSASGSQGFKTAVVNNPDTSSAQNEQNPYNSNYSYSCSAWSADTSEFDLPSGITFMTMPSSSTSGNASSAAGPSCSSCDMVPAGEQRDQCKAALHCQ